MFAIDDKPRVTYYKRYRMEIDLYEADPVPGLSEGFHWVPWDEFLIVPHAEMMFEGFQQGIDTAVFPSLASLCGCYNLMNEIRQKPGFMPEATWLLSGIGGYCGCVQGRREPSGMGSIQNVTVVPRQRGQGLGTALLLRALQGFRRVGLGRAYLEVTAQNERAIQLYQRLGFLKRKTSYIEVVSSRLPPQLV